MRDAVILVFALAVLYWLVIVEGLFVLVAIQAARGKASWLNWRQRKPVRRPVLAIFLLALASRAAIAPLLPRHEPLITDEFSYLLAGDTFASGRLTNPSHPMWKHFESIHILVQPTYMSMYQPAQGLVLAAGIRLAGNPWIGVYLSSALMCSAICWMLLGWLPPRWALLGGALAVLRLGLFGYWVNSFWGGATSAIGGALVLGALPRLMRRLRLRDTLIMGLGTAILAASRPYEGGAMCLGVAVVILMWIPRGALVRFVLPMALILALTAAGAGYYFSRITGSPFQLPEAAQRVPYAMAPIFLWQSAGPEPVYRHKALHDFYAVWEVQEVLPEIKSVSGLMWNAVKKIIHAWLFFLGPALTVPLVFFPRIARDRRMRPLFIVVGVTLIAIAVNAWFYPHYLAPVAGLLLVIVVQGLRRLRVWRRESGEGWRLSNAILAICVAMTGVRLLSGPLGLHEPPAAPMTWYHTPDGNLARARTLAQLSALEGGQLAIVRYGPNHNAIMNEWVYNRADIDGAKVVWARDMSPAENRELLDYYPNRRAWLVEADETPPKVTPYP